MTTVVLIQSMLLWSEQMTLESKPVGMDGGARGHSRGPFDSFKQTGFMCCPCSSWATGLCQTETKKLIRVYVCEQPKWRLNKLPVKAGGGHLSEGIKQFKNPGETAISIKYVVISPAWLEFSSCPSCFSSPGDSSGVSNVPSESELWKQREEIYQRGPIWAGHCHWLFCAVA